MSEVVNEVVESAEVNEIMNNEGPVETESASEVTVEEVSDEPAEESVESVESEESEESTTNGEEEPTTNEAEVVESVTTQEVVQNVQDILSSTETNVSGNDFEERVKVLEERLETLIEVLLSGYLVNEYLDEDDNIIKRPYHDMISVFDQLKNL